MNQARKEVLEKLFLQSRGHYGQCVECRDCTFARRGKTSWNKGDKHIKKTGHVVWFSYMSDLEQTRTYGTGAV